MMLLISGWCFWILLFIVSCENLSFVYVNSINCMVRLSIGFIGGVYWCGSSLIHSKSCLNLALQWHLCCIHVQGRSDMGTVFSCGLLQHYCLICNTIVFSSTWLVEQDTFCLDVQPEHHKFFVAKSTSWSINWVTATKEASVLQTTVRVHARMLPRHSGSGKVVLECMCPPNYG
jgi:hypothetical protein